MLALGILPVPTFFSQILAVWPEPGVGRDDLYVHLNRSSTLWEDDEIVFDSV